MQKSVFECRLNKQQFEELERALLDIIDQDTDCLRFYRLTEPVELHIREYGRLEAVDFDGPLVL